MLLMTHCSCLRVNLYTYSKHYVHGVFAETLGFHYLRDHSQYVFQFYIDLAGIDIITKTFSFFDFSFVVQRFQSIAAPEVDVMTKRERGSRLM